MGGAGPFHAGRRLETARRPLMQIRVECRRDARGDEEPLSLGFDTRTVAVAVAEIVNRWPGRGYGYFKLLGEDGALYVVCHDEASNGWELTPFQRDAILESAPAHPRIHEAPEAPEPPPDGSPANPMDPQRRHRSRRKPLKRTEESGPGEAARGSIGWWHQGRLPDFRERLRSPPYSGWPAPMPALHRPRAWVPRRPNPN